jgi:hypothetical protein
MLDLSMKFTFYFLRQKRNIFLSYMTFNSFLNIYALKLVISEVVVIDKQEYIVVI